MTRLKDQIHLDLHETPRGSSSLRTTSQLFHEFLRFQIEDHKTGDCPMVR
jgi:hypothetical protein